MRRRKPRVLLVEDSGVQARLVRELAGGELAIEWADRLSAALARLSKGGIDAVLLDLALPDSFGMDTLAQVVEACPGVPVIVFTGGDPKEIAAEAVARGAAGVLPKDGRCWEMIAGAVRKALTRRGAVRKKRAPHSPPR